MMDEIRLGTIGSGVIVHSVLDGVQRTDGIALEAVYSRSAETGRKLADCYQAKKIYTDLDELFQDPAVNFIYVATPNSLHYEQVKRALLAGKNVICEKPFCTKKEQAEELVSLAKEKKLFLVEAVPTTFLPNYEVLERELPRIGRIRLVQSSYTQYSSRYDLVKKGEVPNIFNPQFAGGCLMDLNLYNIYLNVALFGAPRNAVYYPNIYPGLTDTSGVAVLQYPDFVSACVAAKDTWGVNSVQIQGEAGYIYIKDGSNGLATIRTVTKTSDETFNEQPDPDRWYYEVQGITKLVLNEEYEAIYSRLDIMTEVVGILETIRKQAQILFPGDSE